uniref:Uncharacterized protein n=1 Tax=Setaria viridis TaxID=4556 RepID=A0A4U6TEH7_SETVI|nr:hypothetical protein SEVIR_8G121150v2 [Setaria viridis]
MAKPPTLRANGASSAVQAWSCSSCSGLPGGNTEEIMVRPLRRLRNLNLEEEEDAEPIENGQDNLSDNENGHDNLVENENDDDLQGSPDVDGLLARLPRHHPQTPIKIIWPNGEVRQGFQSFKYRGFRWRKGNCRY